MRDDVAMSTIPPAESSSPPVLAALQRARRSVVVIDLVESVRMITTDELGVVMRWRTFVAMVREQIVPKHGGRVVKSLGDGLLLEFGDARSALLAVGLMHSELEHLNRALDARQQMQLRAGMHVAEVLVDADELFGSGVNLAARLATLAEPGGTVVSAALRDELVQGLDAELDDLGDCWLKHIEHPVRAYRVRVGRERAASAADPMPRTAATLGTSVAVIPLVCRGGVAGDAVIGDIVADGVIATLSRTPELMVLSRLSTSALRGRELPPESMQSFTGARYVLSGSYVVADQRVLLNVELADARDGSVVHADRLSCRVGELLQEPSEPLLRVAQGAHAALIEREVRRAAVLPLPTLESYALLYGGMGLAHRVAPEDFARAQQLYQALIERVPRSGTAHAWLAHWHCLRIVRGQVSFGSEEGQQTRWRVEQALEREPESALAWALRALVVSWVGKDLPSAEAACEESLRHNPNEPLAWLFSATVQSWQGRGGRAAAAAEKALERSALHPMRYYFEALAGSAFLADGQYARAIELCRHSLRLHRAHTPTHRVLAIAQVLGGQADAAIDTVREMLALQPGYTVERFMSTYPGAQAPHARDYARALHEAGVPLG